MQYEYEYHNFPDDRLKVIFHKNILGIGIPEFICHWHKNIELLYFVEGSAYVMSDSVKTFVKAGEIAIISGYHLHLVKNCSEKCAYYCLIPDTSIYEREAHLPYLSSDKRTVDIFKQIIYEMENQQQFYKETVKGYINALISLLERIGVNDNAAEPSGERNTKLQIVKQVIQYVYMHFFDDISTDDIAGAVGFSKYYLCHVFKEITGQTVLRHLNYVRCNNARTLLTIDKCSVSESAFRSGFTNISYFAKTYKNFFGVLPSSESKRID